MHSIADWQRFLSFAGLIGTIALLVRLHLTGLAPVYRWFIALRFYGMLVTGLLQLVHPRTNLYAVIWACSKPLEWILGVAVVMEIYSLVLHRYPGIVSLTHWAIIAAVIFSLLLSIGLLSLDFHNPHEKFPVLRLAFAVQRTFDNTIVCSLLLPWLLIVRFPIRLCRNVVVHCVLFSAFMGIEAGGLFVRNLLGHTWNPFLNLAMSVGTSLCLLGWILFLDQKGERAEKVVLVQVDPERERHLIEELQAFNRLLLHVAPVDTR
jgi:hypothetical protein